MQQLKPFAALMSAQYRVTRPVIQALSRSGSVIKTPWRLAGRLLARDWKSGEVLVLLAALVVVTIISRSPLVSPLSRPVVSGVIKAS